jgi:polyhydroxybutyrate depolymerase
MPSTKTSFLIILIISITISSCEKLKKPLAESRYRINNTILVDNLKRDYLLTLPPTYFDTKNKFSLVIALHGGGGSALQFEKSSLLTEKANTENFIIVYPEGVESDGLLKAKTWNAGLCCDYAAEKKVDDVKFISLLIDKLTQEYNINPSKVYATGHSNGGMLCYRLACEIPNKIAAIAPNASTSVFETCNNSRPIPILHMHSELDKNIPYLGGKGGGVGTKNLTLQPVESLLANWAKYNTCNQIPLQTRFINYKQTTWNNCDNNITIEFYLTQDGGHSWPGAQSGSFLGDKPSTAIKANDLIWAFFSKY